MNISSTGAGVAVVVPCYNEEMTVAKVVGDARRELPDARVIVFDNNSTDRTAELAREAGAEVVPVPRQGKGAVVREIFRTVDADVIVMVDGDDTYPMESSHELIELVRSGVDMAVGDRLSDGSYGRENKRAFHGSGNALVKRLVNFCFKSSVSDVMTGFRAFSRRFAKNVPVLSDGFEIETEMTIRCLDRKLSLVEVPIVYRDRPEGSFSKLNTFRDGFRVLGMIFTILKDYRPLFFFGMMSLISMIAGLACGLPVIAEFVSSRFITHVPLAVLATGLVLVSITLFNCALVLDSLASHERAKNELAILSHDNSKYAGGGGDINDVSASLSEGDLFSPRRDESLRAVRDHRRGRCRTAWAAPLPGRGALCC